MTLICDLQSWGHEKSMTQSVDYAYMCTVSSNYLERIRSYGPDKRTFIDGDKINKNNPQLSVTLGPHGYVTRQQRLLSKQCDKKLEASTTVTPQ